MGELISPRKIKEGEVVMRIMNNIMALNAHRQLGANQSASARSMEKLSSGLRINRAGDDAAGLAISEKMRGQVRGLKQASSNAQDGISMIQTAEGSLNETHSILQRMRELAVQSSNDTNTDADRKEIQAEIDQLAAEITRIGNNTEFNTQKLLDSSLDVIFHIGANEGQNLGLSIGDMRSDALGVGALFTAADDGTISDADSNSYTFVDKGDQIGSLIDGESNPINASVSGYYDVTTGALRFAADAAMDVGETTTLGIDVSSQTAADTAITTINDAIEAVSAERSKLGATQNRLEHTIANLGTSAENLQAAESRIRDVDMAEEMMAFTKYQILQQASTAMLAQANMAPQSVLQLLG